MLIPASMRIKTDIETNSLDPTQSTGLDNPSYTEDPHDTIAIVGDLNSRL